MKSKTCGLFRTRIQWDRGNWWYLWISLVCFSYWYVCYCFPWQLHSRSLYPIRRISKSFFIFLGAPQCSWTRYSFTDVWKNLLLFNAPGTKMYRFSPQQAFSIGSLVVASWRYAVIHNGKTSKPWPRLRFLREKVVSEIHKARTTVNPLLLDMARSITNQLMKDKFSSNDRGITNNNRE